MNVRMHALLVCFNSPKECCEFEMPETKSHIKNRPQIYGLIKI